MITIIEVLTRTAGRMWSDKISALVGLKGELLSGEILEALANGVWQGIALSLVVWIVLRSLPTINSVTRHAVWLGTLAAIALLPLAGGQLISMSQPFDSGSGPVQSPTVVSGSEDLTASHRSSTFLLRAPTTPPASANVLQGPGAITGYPVSSNTPVRVKVPNSTESVRLDTVPETPLGKGAFFNIQGGLWTVGLVLVWSLIVLYRLVRLVGSVVGIRQLKRNAGPLTPRLEARLSAVVSRAHPRRAVALAYTDELDVPAVLGLGTPTIVLPRAIISALSPEELDQIVLHELAHINRWDDWTQLGECIIAAFIFFHPALRMIRKRLTLEREIACDDWVLSRQRSPKPYAICLSKLLELRLSPQRALPIPGAFLTKQQIVRRIEMILNKKRNANTRLSRTSVLLGAFILVAGIMQAAYMSPVIAVAAPPEPEPSARLVPLPPLPSVPMLAPIVPFAPLPSLRPVSRSPYVILPPVAPVADVPFSRAYKYYAQASALDEQRALMEEHRQAMKEQQKELRHQQREIQRERQEAQREARRAYSSYSRNRSSSGGSWNVFDNFNWGFNGTTITTDDDLTSFSWSRGSHRIRVELEGDVEFTKDDADIASIGGSGYFLIQEKQGRDSKELEVASDRDGSLEYYYFEQRREAEFDDDARAWLAEILPFVIRQSGIGAEARVHRLLGEGGVDRVLEEISLFDSDYGKRQYFGFLLSDDDFSAAEAQKVFRHVGREIDSDYERAELLIRYAKYAHDDPGTLDAFIDAIRDIDSDYETRRVLSAIGTDRELSEHYTAELLDIAGQMDSDYERAELLMELAEFSRNQPELQALYVDAVETIGSDYEKRRVLSRLLMGHLSDPDVIHRILEISRTIDSDYERAELLRELADEASDNDRLMQTYLEASMTIGSDYEKRRVLSALTFGDQLSDEVLFDLLDVAADIGSDYEKAEFLIEFSRYFTGSESLKDAYADAADTIDSDYERDRVLAQLYRRDRKSRSSKRGAR